MNTSMQTCTPSKMLLELYMNVIGFHYTLVSCSGSVRYATPLGVRAAHYHTQACISQAQPNTAVAVQLAWEHIGPGSQRHPWPLL